MLEFLINNAHKEIRQSIIHTMCNATPAYACKLLKELKSKGIIEKNYRNTIKVINPLMLCFLLAYEKKLPKPAMFKTTNYKNVMSVLQNTIYSFTLGTAVKIRENNQPSIIYAYVLGKDMQLLEKEFTRTRRNPDMVIYPADSFKFLKQELVNNVFTATLPDLFTDFLRAGKTSEAFRLAKKYKLFRNIIQ